MTVFAHKRPIIFNPNAANNMIGFIDWDPNYTVKSNNITSAGVYQYSVKSTTRSWIIFNHSTSSLVINSNDNVIKLSGNQYASSNFNTNTNYYSLMIPMNVNDNVTFTSYRQKKNDLIEYNIFKELPIDPVIDNQVSTKVGFIGNLIKSGSLSSTNNIGLDPSNANFKKNVIEVDEDCWLYVDKFSSGLMFCNAGDDAYRKIATNWVTPFTLLTTSRTNPASTVTGRFSDNYVKCGNAMTVNGWSILIPLQKGQSFGMANGGHSVNYSLYKMDYSWNSFVSRINFNDVIYKPIVQLPTGSSKSFEYVAPRDCWVFVSTQAGDKWSLDGKNILINSAAATSDGKATANAKNRHGIYVPVRMGQVLSAKLSFAATNKNSWGYTGSDNIRFAVYGMQPII